MSSNEAGPQRRARRRRVTRVVRFHENKEVGDKLAHLYKFRQGWQSENLARFLLSEFAFIAQPSTIADDVGSDFYCTLFKKEKHNGNHHLIPKNSFLIQIKSSLDDIDLSNKAAFIEQLELPFFIGVVDRQKLNMRIYSGRSLHLLFTMFGSPSKLVATLTPEILNQNYYEVADEKQKHFNLFFPFLAEVGAENLDKDAEIIFPIMATECALILQNISSRNMGEYILGFGPNDVRIFAGSSSVQQFRRNFCYRMAEVFYNLEWLFVHFPDRFPKTEFAAYAESWARIRPHCSQPEQLFVDSIHDRVIHLLSEAESSQK